MSKFLEGLNSAQKSAVENYNGPSLVIAGAGSGKTRVLTYRIAYMLEQKVSPSEVLSLTFTNKAAREMKERIGDVVGVDKAQQLWMGTFHSVFSRILRREAEVLGYPETFSIYDSHDSKQVIRAIVKRLGLGDRYKPKVLMSRISNAKNNLMLPSEYAHCKAVIEHDTRMGVPKLYQVYKEYINSCKSSGAMDFDDLLLMTNVLFRDHPEVLERYQTQFKYVMVDEYQDTNFAQFTIVKKLVKRHQNVCVVGDDAQSIYSFRGAKIENILNFEGQFKDCKIFKLEQNYRSTQTIVNAANSVIKKNKNQLEKTTFSNNEVGHKITVMGALKESEEGERVVREMIETKNSTDCNWDDFTILYRTNAQSRVFEEKMRKRGIPYKIYGGLSFYQRSEVKDIVAYFRLATNVLDGTSFKRVFNQPKRGLGATTLNRLEDAAALHSYTLMDVASNPNHCQAAYIKAATYKKIKEFVDMINDFSASVNMVNAYDFAVMVIERTGYLKALEQNVDESGSIKYEDRSRIENVNELLAGIKEFSDNAIENGNSYRITDLLGEIALLTDQDGDQGDEERVTLMTVHSSKGLEFKNVFIVGLEDKLFPSYFDGDINAEELEEERRLFYVAVTRAEKRVWLSYAKQRFLHGQMKSSAPSRFISEIDKQFCIYPAQDDYDFYQERKRRRKEIISESQAPLEYGDEGEEDGDGNGEGDKFSVGGASAYGNRGVRLGSRIAQIKSGAGDGNIDVNPTPIKLLQEGDRVRHNRMGDGEIISLNINGANKEAHVRFDKCGTKRLLLKFARLERLS